MAKKDDLESLAVLVEGLDLDENELGHGAYGVVYAVSVNRRPCIAKKLHALLIQAAKYLPNTTTKQKDIFEARFRNECLVLSKLNHQNIVQFVGVHYGRNKSDLSLVMERLHSNLSDFLENNPATPLPVRLSILRDVACGLLYLHTLTPPLIHRDLTAPNILLTENATRAKICDLGVSKYVDPNVAAIMSAGPGNIQYMPPEAFYENPVYTIKLDIFSYGHLIVHTINGSRPDVYSLPLNVQIEFARDGKIELMRRDKAIHVQMGINHCLYPLVVHCLHDNLDSRPTTDDVNKSLQDLCKCYTNKILYEACERGNVEHVRVLLEGGADPNQTNEDGWTALYIASRNGHEKIVAVLLESGCDVDIQSNGGKTALFTSSFSGHDQIVLRLIVAGAKLDTQSEHGITALHVASLNGHHQVVQILIAAKASINLQTNDAFTALHIASHNGHHQVVQTLIASKAYLNLQGKNGQTALYIASLNGHERVVEVLLESGCGVDIQTNSNYTPLMVAACCGHRSIVSLLISKGANTTVKDMCGFTAYQLALVNGHLNVCQLLPFMESAPAESSCSIM